MKFLLRIMIGLAIISSAAYSQTRIAFLPFTNMDGDAKYNIWCYNLQDSLAKEMALKDGDGKMYSIVPMDSVEAVLAEMNLDPANPQYLSDLWLAVEKLNVKHVITGNFKIKAKRFLINAYIYDVATKLPNNEFFARDIFKPEEKLYESVPIIARSLAPYYSK